MKKFIEENSHSYEIIFFQHIRSSQYLPKNYYGTTILIWEIFTLIITLKLVNF